MSNALEPIVIDNAVESVHEADAISAVLDRACATANALNVIDTETEQKAADYISELTSMVGILEAIIERFRKPAYEYYERVLAEKRRLTSGPNDAIQRLRDQMREYREAAEVRLLEAKKEYAEKGDQASLDSLETAQNAAGATISGLAYRERWKAEIVDLRALCAAVARGDAPYFLVEFNQKEANKVANSLREAMDIPGVTAHRTLIPVRQAKR